MRTTPLCFHPAPDNTAGGGKAAPRGPGAGAGTMGGVTGASGAGRGDQRTGGTAGVETEKATDGEGVASGGSLARAMKDAHVHPTNDPDRPANNELRQDVMPDIPQSQGGTPNPT